MRPASSRPKHQSFWDAYAFVPYIPDPIYILKRELMWIPLFGWYVGKMKMIPVHRGSRSVALKSIIKGAQPAIAEKRQIMIYPEGTRRAPGDDAKLQIRHRPSLHRIEPAGGADRPCGRALLAAPPVHALSRHHQMPRPASNSAGPERQKSF